MRSILPPKRGRYVMTGTDKPLSPGSTKPKVAIPPWTFHDLCRSFASGLARLGVAPHIIERCLNHKVRGVARYLQPASIRDRVRCRVEAVVGSFDVSDFAPHIAMACESPALHPIVTRNVASQRMTPSANSDRQPVLPTRCRGTTQMVSFDGDEAGYIG